MLLIPCFVNISRILRWKSICQGMITEFDGVELELGDSEKFVISNKGKVKVVTAMAVPKISIVICLGVFFFLEGSPASIYLTIE